MSNYEFYKVEQKGPIAWVFLNRPEKNNAMNLPAWIWRPHAIFDSVRQMPSFP